MNKIIKSMVGISAAITMMCGIGTEAYQEGVFSNTAIVAEAAAYVPVIRGCFNGNNWSGYTKITKSQTQKNAKIKVCAFRQDGKIKSGKFKVEVYGGDWRSQNNYVGTYDITGYGSISLKYGYSHYKVRIRRNNGWWNPGDNISKTQYWSIDGTTNVAYFN